MKQYDGPAAALPVGAIELLEFERHLLASLAEAINSDLDLRRVLQTVTDVGTEVTKAQFGAFFYNDRDEHGHVYQLNVVSGAGLETFAAMPKPRITALFEPTFSGQSSVRVADVVTDPRFTGLPPGHLPVRSYLAVPVVTRTGEVIGSLLFGHAEPSRFDARCEQVVEVIAGQAAVAVENARSFAAEQVARQRAEEATARLALLQSLTAALSSALRMDQAIDAVTQLLTRTTGVARSGLFVRDGDSLVHRSEHGPWHDNAPLLTVLDDAVASPVRTAETTRSCVVVKSAAEFVAAYPALASSLERVPPTVLALPLTTAGTVIGVWSLSWDAPHQLDAADIEMFGAAAAQLALAVERARLFAAERAARSELAESIRAATETSRALQRSLLPRQLPHVDDLDVAVRYQASSSDAEVGGDWYDLVPTETGCVLVIGDVQGHNLAAAALMGQLRTALHAYLAEGHPIDSAAARANDLMMQLTDSMIATCAMVQLDVVEGRLHSVRAGHPSPVCLRGDGSISTLPDRVGLPLGAVPGSSWPVVSLPFHTGDRVVLYTDGLVERRGHDIYEGVARLRELLQEVVAESATDAAQLVVDRLGGQRTDDTDDIAILIADARLPGPLHDRAPTDRSSDIWTAAIDRDDNIAVLRQRSREQLRAWHLSDLDYAATLVVSELTTNVLRHTVETGRLQLQRLPGGIRIAVTDRDDRMPVLDLAPDATAVGGRGLLLLRQQTGLWGIERHSVGKTIWADLLLPETADAPSETPIGAAATA